MVTIKDIASATGVSATTVSNVINGKTGRVSAETVAKINKAIDDLGYVPNMSSMKFESLLVTIWFTKPITFDERETNDLADILGT